MTTAAVSGKNRPWEEQRQEFCRRRLVAMPIAGIIAWAVVGIAGLFLPPLGQVWSIFIATGAIAYLGIGISKFTGENFMAKDRPKNVFDGLFFHGVGQALLVYAIAIPFLQRDYTSLPLTVGILTGLMWVPVSWIIGHPIGWFHAVARTFGVTAVWYLFPEHRFVVIPAVIVAVYVVTIVVLERRWRAVTAA